MSGYLRPFFNVTHRLCRESASIKRSAYSSAVSLDKLYPGKSLSLSTPSKVSADKNDSFTGHIPIEKLHITYSRSGGAGGQNVNMLNSKVDVRFHVESADWLSNEVKSKLIEMNKTKINKEGFLILKSEKTRSQQLNVADVMMKLRTLIRTAAEPPGEPSEESVEAARKRKMKAARLRLQEKRNHSMNKAQRRAPVIDY
ncbi:peptidyl-tRNA hydrolase ICT1, mitochondrial [Ischnura elegans]|uniref:peptidyl-tRNA hydrolase ICT1, mitochondrial n=1 Tax=Ischnura elegans TaxID=197161 RepID=UPI001ED87F87|nr:peptidyl-tRNA hydrolase ICT1, mitochondrial [Ischnura elegans]